ncbi:TetR/AcrR family transcriptional regulator [Micromonospora carbonacea]|uniref:TetR/AcrR family transcriptional regulator n=1 Tax=Micromonospora carbonacea TaxID=47853 RepID=A0A7H8XN08_9ACTN|nr:TetR/AcrR family transcriptional regulator [Micromonospora carbonacea]MBB5825735.1 AcrR family transcriptional regulator [Micromonospora carbonacea]QLD26255.1 TetR/AcrR family transcriptional regulator [Micromonospora carbonacea]
MQNARDRLLLAAAELLQGGGTVSTRAVCDRAGVQAPTLYHHFGSKQGLIDAVANHGFTQYTAVESSGDPLDDLREGWDRHVRFGLEHPSFYGLLYGRVEPGRPCAITAPAHAALRERLTAAAARGMLRVPADDAAEQVLAANVGVTLTLISQPEPDFGLSGRVREAALAGVLHTPSADTPTTRASAALTLRALADDDPGDLTPGERGLLGELLDRLAR